MYYFLQAHNSSIKQVLSIHFVFINLNIEMKVNKYAQIFSNSENIKEQ